MVLPLDAKMVEFQTLSNGRSSNADSDTEFSNSINGVSLDSTDLELIFEDVDSTCSTPYVSAPSSPGRGPVNGFFYSAPASPMHFSTTKNSKTSAQTLSMENNHSYSFEFDFDFSARFGSNVSSSISSMSSADELFLDGKIRPMKVSTTLESSLSLAPLLEDEEGAEMVEFVRGRDLRLRDKLQRRRTRSMSPLRNTPIEWTENENEGETETSIECSVTEKENSEKNEIVEKTEEVRGSNSETSTPSISASSSRSSSAGRNSKRWIFLKDFLHRSKSEGRNQNNFWSNISFTPSKEKKTTNRSVSKDNKPINPSTGGRSSESKKIRANEKRSATKKLDSIKKPENGIGKRRVPPTPHELHYTANRAYSEEMKKKTYLPYRQGLLGCLGFSSKGYGAVNGFAKALNSVSSR